MIRVAGGTGFAGDFRRLAVKTAAVVDVLVDFFMAITTEDVLAGAIERYMAG